MKSNKTLNYFTNLHYVLQFFVVVVETLFEWFYRENNLLATYRVDFPSCLNTALLKMAIFFQLFPFHLLIHMYEVCVVFIYFRMNDSLLCKQVNQNIHFILWFIVHPFHFPMNICTHWNNFMQISFKRTSISPLVPFLLRWIDSTIIVPCRVYGGKKVSGTEMVGVFMLISS